LLPPIYRILSTVTRVRQATRPDRRKETVKGGKDV
jgi:hypothetical protein